MKEVVDITHRYILFLNKKFIFFSEQYNYYSISFKFLSYLLICGIILSQGVFNS